MQSKGRDPPVTPAVSGSNPDNEPPGSTHSSLHVYAEPDSTEQPGLPGSWRQPGSLQPPNLFSNEAAQSWFPASIVLTPGGNVPGEVPPGNWSDFCDGDPIHGGLVSYHVATSLFHGYV